jgi:outer membrane protein, adhesin transport system
MIRHRLSTLTTLLFSVLLSFSSIAAEDKSLKNENLEAAGKPTGVLANAANAAAAAANAATAAANAANAAASAATAALEAINSISGYNRAATAEKGTTGTGAITTRLPSDTPAQIIAKPQEAESRTTSLQSVSQSPRFFVPAERSLVGLTGKFEIPVFTDARSDLAKSIAGYQTAVGEPVGEISETNLAESILVGRGYSRDSLIAGAKAEQAKAQTGQALALLLPSVSVRASTGWETSAPSVALDPATGRPISSETHTRTDASLVVKQPLFDLPSYFDWKRRGVIEKARNESYRSSDGDAYLATVNAYLALVSTRLQADMTRDFEAQLNELLVYVEKRAKAGAASVSDMARVRARTQSAVSSRMELESAHTAAGVEFIRLTNRLPKMLRLPELNDVGASLLPESLDYAVTMAMLNNPDIGTLNSEVQAAGIDKSASKSRYLPRVDLEYTENYSLHAGGDTSSAGQRDRRVMFVLNWSLFSGGSDYRFHQERIARKDELKYRLDDQRRRVTQTLSSNYGTISATKERLDIGYQELNSISTAADAMSKRMLSGNQSLLDLLDVYDRYYQARMRLVNLHILEMNTMAQAVRLVKGPPSAATSGQPASTGNTVSTAANKVPAAVNPASPAASAAKN